jgi:serine/threonine protein kinase
MRFECGVCKKLVSIKEGELGIEVICPHCTHSVKVPDSKLSNGFVVADFIIRDEIGHGGMGVVYSAHQISLDRPSAVKVLNHKYAKDFEFVANFVKEARAAARLNHPNIVQAYAVGADSDIFYFAMEFVDGETMKQIMKREKIIPIDKAMNIIQEITEALDYGWKEQKMIHCDIKPDNIMITSKGIAKLADLGLARRAEDTQDDDDEVLGTPQYISPEQLTGDKLDIRTDIFSLGATLYQFVTARLPFEGNSLNEIARKRLTHDPIQANKINPDVPDTVNQIIMKMLKRNPDDRYKDCVELLADLKRLQSGSVPVQAKSNANSAKGKQFSVRRREVPAEHQTMTSPTIPVTGTMSLDKQISNALGKNVIMLGGGAAVILVLIAVAVWLTVFSGGESPSKSPPTTGIVTPRVTTSNDNSGGSTTKQPDKVSQASIILKFNFQIQKMLSDYRKNRLSKTELLAKVDQLMVRYPEIPDAKSFNKLLEAYVPLDESRISDERSRLRQRHQAEIAARVSKASDKQAEQRRLSAAEQHQRDLAAKERRLSEELAKKEREAKLKDLRELASYKALINIKKDQLRFKFADLCITHQFNAANDLLEAAKKEKNKVRYASPQKIAEAGRFVRWLDSLQSAIKKSEVVYTLFNDSGKEFANKQIEKNYKLYTIQSINNGLATISKPSSEDEGTETVKVNLESLGRSFWVFFNKVVKKRGIKDARFYYYLSKGYFQHKMVPPDSFWTEELSQLKYQYFKQKYATASAAEKKNMIKLYGKLYSFKRATNQ